MFRASAGDAIAVANATAATSFFMVHLSVGNLCRALFAPGRSTAARSAGCIVRSAINREEEAHGTYAEPRGARPGALPMNGRRNQSSPLLGASQRRVELQVIPDAGVRVGSAVAAIRTIRVVGVAIRAVRTIGLIGAVGATMGSIGAMLHIKDLSEVALRAVPNLRQGLVAR